MGKDAQGSWHYPAQLESAPAHWDELALSGYMPIRLICSFISNSWEFQAHAMAER
jgi:hypothetical protein